MNSEPFQSDPGNGGIDIKRDRESYFGVGIIKITSSIDPLWGEVFKLIRYDNIDERVKSQTVFVANFSLTVEDPDHFIYDINRKLYHLRINDSYPTTFKTTCEDIKKRTKTLHQFNNLFTRQYSDKKIENFFEMGNNPVLDRLDSIYSILSNLKITEQQTEQTELEHTEHTEHTEQTEQTELEHTEQTEQTELEQTDLEQTELEQTELEQTELEQTEESPEPILVERSFSHGLTELQMNSVTEFLNLFVVKSPGQGCVGRAKLWTCYSNWCVSEKIIDSTRVEKKNFLNYVCMNFFRIEDEVKSGSYITNGRELDTNQGWRNYWINTEDKSLGGKPDGFLGPRRTVKGVRTWSDYSKFLNPNE